MTSLSALTATGTSLASPAAPVPSSPKWFSPHVITVPVPSSAMLCSPPAEIAVAPARPLTAAGTSSLRAIEPVPSSPHAIAVPLASNARL